MATIRRFTKEDWDGLAGAVCFADGSNPFVAFGDDIVVDGVNAMIVGDANSIQVILQPVGDDDMYLGQYWTLCVSCNGECKASPFVIEAVVRDLMRALATRTVQNRGCALLVDAGFVYSG